MKPLKNLDQWEEALGSILNKIDNELEDTYGELYPLRSNRSPRGSAANPTYDGLFSVDAKFSLGLGRREGRNYCLEVRMATFSQIPEATKKEIADRVGQILEEEIPRTFPNHEIHISREGNLFRIHGDLGWD